MDQAREFLTHFSGPQSYAIFYFILIGCGLGLPFNSDLMIISASVLAALGYFKLIFLMPIAYLGLLSGDTINYWVARTYGKKILSIRPFRWLLNPQKVCAAETYLNQKGTRFLFFVRFLPLIRTVLYFTAGSLQVPPRTFFLMDGLSTLIYVPLLMSLAYYAGENIDSLVVQFKQIQFLLLGFLLLVLSILFIRKPGKKPVSP
ncbi:MAG: DedA family protein [Bdellovibrionales bacterium]|nr:DedA family protein [Oligoflexia bacterium]